MFKIRTFKKNWQCRHCNTFNTPRAKECLGCLQLASKCRPDGGR